MDIKLSDFPEAEEMLAPIIHHTETMSSTFFSNYINGKVYLKLENLQKTASFKIRGAAHKIFKMTKEGSPSAFITASAGNHAQGVAYAARSLGVKAKVVMPLDTPLMKIDAAEGYGAEIILYGSCFDEAYQEALRINETEQAAFIHPYNDIDVITGQGTVAVEILEDCPEAEVILVPAGGGGLLSGIATAAKKINPEIKVIGVQSKNANAVSRSFSEKRHIVTETSDTIADGIAVKNPGEVCLDLIYQNVDEMMEVGDEDISLAILTVLERAKLIIEPAGAASVAALMRYSERFAGKNVICVLSGGNVDTKKLYHYLEIGMMKTDRWIHFIVIIKNDSGDLYSVVNDVINKCGATIFDFDVDRYFTGNSKEFACSLTCEVRNTEHKERLIATLKENFTVIFPEELELKQSGRDEA